MGSAYAVVLVVCLALVSLVPLSSRTRISAVISANSRNCNCTGDSEDTSESPPQSAIASVLLTLCNFTASASLQQSVSVDYSPPHGGPTFGLTAVGWKQSIMRAATRLGITDLSAAHFRLCGSCEEELPQRRTVVMWQTEQIMSRRDMRPYFSFTNVTIWEFSPANIPYLSAFRNSTLMHVPLWHTLQCSDFSYTAGSEQVTLPPGPLDALFFGTMNARRHAIREQLAKANVSVWMGSVWGDMQHALIRKARVVIAMHYYEQPASLEVHRIDRLLALGKCVVAERGADRHLDFIYSDVVVVVAYEEIADTVRRLLRHPQRLAECGERSRRWIAERVADTEDFDRALLAALV